MHQTVRSQVNESLKNGIVISVDISKELACYDDSKYIIFIKFSVTHQRLWVRENLLEFKKGGKHPLKVK